MVQSLQLTGYCNIRHMLQYRRKCMGREHVQQLMVKQGLATLFILTAVLLLHTSPLVIV